MLAYKQIIQCYGDVLTWIERCLKTSLDLFHLKTVRMSMISLAYELSIIL